MEIGDLVKVHNMTRRARHLQSQAPRVGLILADPDFHPPDDEERAGDWFQLVLIGKEERYINVERLEVVSA